MRLITRARRDAALVGVGLGTLAVLALTVAAVIGLTPRPPEAAPTGPHDTEARLHTALLEGRDLPASFSRRPIALPSRTPSAPRREGCAQLVADPVAVLRWLHPARDGVPAGSARHVGADHGVLDQAVRVFDRGEAATAMDTLRRTAGRCKAFTAKLDDGTQARVTIVSTDRADLLIGDSYTVSMTLHTPLGQQEGYLAIGRVGDVVSVLRRTAPSGSDQAALDQQIHDLLGRAVDKIVGLDADLGGLVATAGAK